LGSRFDQSAGKQSNELWDFGDRQLMGRNAGVVSPHADRDDAQLGMGADPQGTTLVPAIELDAAASGQR
jgi:hypothetical protein